MWFWIITIILGGIFALLAAWVTRNMLGVALNWTRAALTAFVVYFLSLPLVLWVLNITDVYEDGRFIVAEPVAFLFIAVAIAWVFTLVVIVLVALEMVWPSTQNWNPIRTVQELFRRRDRFKRYLKLARIASKYGLGALSHRKNLDNNSLPQAIVEAVNEAGVTFIKIGQVLSTRDDILPKEYTDAFATLQMASTPLPWSEIKPAIEKELKKPLDEMFSEVNPEPLAAASVAQVHAATLLDGREVIIKIQRPKAREQVETDLDIIGRMARDAERRGDWAAEYGVVALADEFSRSLREELDYRIELKNTELLKAAIATGNISSVTVPDVYPELSTRQMLIQERVHGTPFSLIEAPVPDPVPESSEVENEAADASAQLQIRVEVEYRNGPITADDSVPAAEPVVVAEPSNAAPQPQPQPGARSTARGSELEVLNNAEIESDDATAKPRTVSEAYEQAQQLLRAMFEMIAVRGVFHADLHPGNLILKEDGTVALIDFGSIGILERSMRNLLVQLLIAIRNDDDAAATDLALMIVANKSTSNIDVQQLQRDIGAIITRIHNGQSDGSLFGELIAVLRHHHLAAPPSLVLVMRTLGSLEGTLRQFSPGFDMADQALKIAPEVVLGSTSLKRSLAVAQNRFAILSEQISVLPRRIDSITKQLNEGTLGFRMRALDSESERNWLSLMLGQATSAIVGCALLVTSVILLISHGGPMLTEDVQVFPFIGSVVGLGGMLLVLRSLRTAFREKR